MLHIMALSGCLGRGSIPGGIQMYLISSCNLKLRMVYNYFFYDGSMLCR